MQAKRSLIQMLGAIFSGFGLLLSVLALFSFLAAPSRVAARFPEHLPETSRHPASAPEIDTLATPAPVAASTLTNVVSAPEVLPGGLLTFTLTVSFTGASRLETKIPEGTRLYRLLGLATYDDVNDSIVSQADASRVVTLVVQVFPRLREGTVIRSVAQLTAQPTTQVQATATAVVRRYYVPRQVVITGPQAAIVSVLESLSPSLRLELQRRIDLSYFRRLPPAVPLPISSVARSTLQVHLYRFLADPAVADVVQSINTRAKEKQVPVFADANLLAGRVPLGISGDPWSDFGSPVPGEPISATHAFTSQWALGTQGIGLTMGAGRSMTFTGDGVRVGLFDTSPFSVPVGAEEPRTVGDLQLTVAHPQFSASLPPPTATQAISDHGLFAASLVHAVAPSATLKLVRVLDDYGQGTLFDLNDALAAFITETLVLSRPGVINLSLGVHPPPDGGLTGLPLEVTALKTILGGAAGFDFVVIAAAGNDSTMTSTMPLQIPASFSTAIGVTASSFDGGKACFSNAGTGAPGIYPQPWLAAPGGACGETLPDDYVIGRGLSSPSDFLYWQGTSFAAPLVSGIAVLVLQRGSLTPTLVFSQTRELLLRGTASCGRTGLGAGIANVWKTLDLEVTPPAPAFLCGDFDRNATVAANDIASAANNWRTQRGDGAYAARFDYDADGRTGMADLMAWAQFFGNTWP